MGLPDLYPFVLAPPVIVKLSFVHDCIRAARWAPGRALRGHDACGPLRRRICKRAVAHRPTFGNQIVPH